MRYMKIIPFVCGILFSILLISRADASEELIACIKRNIAALDRNSEMHRDLESEEKSSKDNPKIYCKFLVEKGLDSLSESIERIKRRRSDFCFSDNMRKTQNEVQDILRKAYHSAVSNCDIVNIMIPNKVSKRVRNALE